MDDLTRNLCACLSFQDILHHQFCIECPVKCIQGVLYVRVSAQIYNELEDYRKLGMAVQDILQASQS
jgi:selenocysteine lyase/cysteine desulfurase